MLFRSEGRAATLAVLRYVLISLLKMLHPFMPFITDEVYRYIPGTEGTIMLSDWPQVKPELSFAEEEREMEGIMDVIRAVRNLRAEMNVSVGRRAHLIVRPKTGWEHAMEGAGEYFGRLAWASGMELLGKDDEAPAKTVSAVSEAAELFIPLGDLVDVAKETARLTKERGLTYSVPLKAKLKLYCTDPDHEDFDTVIQDVYLGPIPYMTPKGTFVINGAERVVVSQLHRSPGVFFGQSVHANGTKLYSARIIPFKGSWIEFATDINNVMYAYIDRKKKLPVTTLLRAVGFENDKDILEIFNLAEDVKVNKTNLKKVVGRKLAARVLKTWTEDFVDEDTGEVVSIERNEVIIDRETVIEEDHIDEIIDSGVQNILVHKEEANSSDYSIIFNTLQKDPSNSEKEAVLYIYRQLRNADPADDASAREVINNLFFSEKRYDLGEVGRYRINKKLGLTTDMDVKVLTKQDIIEIIKYLIELINSKADVDDIDHLSNRRVRTVGEQLSNQFAIGLARMSRTIRERMNVRDNEVFTPIDLINAKTISSVINSFFGTNALSQFMDQTNPLAEITHKRRLSALGPGGLSREQIGRASCRERV